MHHSPNGIVTMSTAEYALLNAQAASTFQLEMAVMMAHAVLIDDPDGTIFTPEARAEMIEEFGHMTREFKWKMERLAAAGMT